MLNSEIIKSEHTEPFPILRVEKIAEYLGVAPGKVRTMLRNLEDGSYCVEVDPGKWVLIVGVPVKLEGGMAWTPASVRLDGPFPLVIPLDRFKCKTSAAAITPEGE